MFSGRKLRGLPSIFSSYRIPPTSSSLKDSNMYSSPSMSLRILYKIKDIILYYYIICKEYLSLSKKKFSKKVTSQVSMSADEQSSLILQYGFIRDDCSFKALPEYARKKNFRLSLLRCFTFASSNLFPVFIFNISLKRFML